MKTLLAILAGMALPLTCLAPKLIVTNILPVEQPCLQLTVVGWTESSFTFCVPVGKWYLERADTPTGPWTIISALNVEHCAHVTDQFEGPRPSTVFYRLTQVK